MICEGERTCGQGRRELKTGMGALFLFRFAKVVESKQLH